MKTTEITDANVTELFDKISVLIEEARQRVSTTVNIAEVYTKFNVGRYIVEDEQKGNYRAEYGTNKLSSYCLRNWRISSETVGQLIR